MMNIKSILKVSAIVLLSAMTSFAKVDTAKLVVTEKDGSTRTVSVKLEKIDENTNRLKIETTKFKGFWDDFVSKF